MTKFTPERNFDFGINKLILGDNLEILKGMENETVESERRQKIRKDFNDGILTERDRNTRSL
jgi:hypothetical protein